jgi:two-component system phosphate regulon sensor histidine kinase PhoR
MRDQDRGTDGLTKRILARISHGWRVTAVGVLVAVLAVVSGSVGPLAALAALVLLLAALAATPVMVTPPTTPKVPAGGPAWPDTGLKLAVDAIADPCILTDAAGLVRFQNRAATERLGPPRPGDPLSFKLRVPELLAAVDRAGRGEAVEPVHFVDRVPTERHWRALVTPIRAGRAGERKRADFVMVRLVDETDLVRLDRMRADFVANASHELRTPLASLTGFIETLLGPARDDAANRERFLKIMLEQAGRMARLIDDLLSLSRIEMRVHVRPDQRVDLAPVVGHVADTLAPLARDNEARIVTRLPDGPATVNGDRDELIQVVSNLVENGVKYGRPGGTVTVTLAAEDGPDQTPGWCLSVADDGPGIAAEHLPRLTERFYRIDADTSRRQKGTGLGLAIVKHIVNRHRGRLTIRSEVGRGSTFSVWIAAADVCSTADRG